MKNVKAIISFDHDGNRKRGSVFAVSDKHAAELEKKRLVKIVGDAPEESTAALSANSVPEGRGGPNPPPAPPTPAQIFLDGKVDEVKARIEGSDKELLQAALEEETSKGDKARKGVTEALTAALAA